MKRIASVFLSIYALLFMTSCASQEIWDKSDQITIMIYMIGSDLEESSGLASADIQEMLKAELNPNVKIYLMAGGSRRWNNEIPVDLMNIYQISDHKLESIHSQPAADMASPKTLSDFLCRVYDKEQGEGNYSLILWDHGMGPLEGFGVDTLYQGHCMGLSALAMALDDSPFAHIKPLSWIGFDACLMASLETAMALSPYADYMIASQEAEPKFGWDYQFLNQIDATQTPEKQMTAIGDAFLSFYDRLCENQPNYNPVRTLSVVDLGEVDRFSAVIGQFFSKANNEEIEISVADYERQRAKVVNIGRFSTGQYYDLVDIQSVAELVRSVDNISYDVMIKELDNLVIRNWSNVNYAHGLSIFSPFNNMEEYDNSWQRIFKEISVSDAYYDFINHIIMESKSLSDECFDADLLPLAEYNENGFLICLHLDQKQMENYASSRIWVFSEEGFENTDDKKLVLRLAYSVDDYDAECGIIQSSFNGELLFAEDRDGEYAIMAMSPDKYRYLVPSLLQKSWGEHIQDSEEFSIQCWLQIEKTNDNKFVVVGGITGDKEFDSFDQKYASGKKDLCLNEWSWIDYISLLYTRPEDGRIHYIPDVYYGPSIIDGEIRIASHQSKSPLYAMYIITDLAGVTHETQVVKLK